MKDLTINTEPIGISAEQAAALLGVSKPKVYELMSREDFPACKLGGRTIISYAGLKEWLSREVTKNENTACLC